MQGSPPSQSKPQYEPELVSTPEDILAELGLVSTSAVPTPEESPDPVVEAAPAADQPPAPAPEVEVKAVEVAAPPPPDPKFQQLLDREAALVDREAAIKEYGEAVKTLQSQFDAYEEAKRNFKVDPVSFLRSLDPELDADSLARELWYERLGVAAPPEYRLKKETRAAVQEVHKTRAELEAERKRIAEENARKEAETSEAQYVDSLRGYASTVPSAFPLVQSLAKAKPDVAVRMLHDAARMIAPGLKRRPTAEEAAKAVQQYLDEIGYVATPAPVQEAQVQTTQVSAPVVSPTPTTIRNSHSAVQPGRVPPDPSDPRVLRRQAYQAMAEALGNPALADLPVD